MKVDLTYTNKETNRKRTLKNVKYLGRAHARAISEAVDGSINYPLPVGFRMVETSEGTPVLRPDDRRKIAKKLRQTKKAVNQELRSMSTYFRGVVDIYSVKEGNHPRTRVIPFEELAAVEYSKGHVISARMGDLTSLIRECSAHDTMFDDMPAYIITPNNQETFEDWLEYNARYEGNTALYDFIQSTKGSQAELCFVILKNTLQLNLETLSHGVQPGFQDAADIPVGRGQPLLSSRFIRYDIQQSDTFVEMFNLPPMTTAGENENTCLYDAVFEMLKRDHLWRSTHKELWASIEKDPHGFMWLINHPNEVVLDNIPMATLREFYPMFDLLRKDLRVFDLRNKIWMCRHPYKATYRNGVMKYILDEDCDRIETRPDNNTLCKCLSFVVHSNHVYLLNRPQAVTCVDELQIENYYQPSSSDERRTTDYVLPQEEDEDLTEEDRQESGYYPADPIVVYTDSTSAWYDRIAQYISQTKFTHYTIYTGDDMLQMGMQLFQRTGYEAGFVAQGSDLVHGLNITNLWRDDIQLKVSIRPFPAHLKRHVDPYTDEASALLKSYMEESKRLKCQLLTKIAMSEYSDETRKLLRYYKMGGISDFYGDQAMPGFEAFGLDFNKFYPSIMCKWDKVPAFSVFDRPLRYDGHAIEPHTLYEVQQLETAHSYSKKMFHMAYGSTLLRLPSDHPPYRLISFIRPSKIVPSDYATQVKALMNRTDLDVRVLKTLLASMSGLLGISYYKRHGSKILFNEEEAGHYMALMGNKAIVQSREVDERLGKVYLVSESRKQELHSGFDPLFMKVIDESLLEVHLLEQRLRRLGYPVLGRRVDNVYLNIPADDEETKDRLRADLGPLVENGQRGFEAFGLLKFEAKHLPDQGMPRKMTIVNNRLMHNCEVTEPTTHQVDEWDEEDIFNKLDELRASGKHVQMLADCPGAGKTTVLVRYAKSRGLTVVLMSFMNKTVFLRREDFNGYDGATLSTISLLKESGNLGMLKEVDMVIIDEWATTPIPVLTPIKRMIRDIKWLTVTSDVHQNAAINVEHNAIADVHEYYTRLTNDICKDVIRLKEPKRSRCPCHQKVYTLPEIRDCPECIVIREKTKRIVRGILDAPTEKDAVNFVLRSFRQVDWLGDLPDNVLGITYYQNTRSKMNHHFHGRVSKAPYYVGQALVCRQRYLKMINKVRHSIHVNYEVDVIGVDGNKVTLLEPLTGWEFQMSANETAKYFLYAHAGTCHGVQGATHDGPVCVFDTWSPLVTRNWLLVAVTRNVNLNNTVIYTGQEVKDLEVSLRHQIEGMIRGHREADKKAKRLSKPKDYVTPEDVMQLLADVRVCAVCGTDDIGPQSFSIDRICSDVAHTKGNVQLLCSSRCNASKKIKFISS